MLDLLEELFWPLFEIYPLHGEEQCAENKLLLDETPLMHSTC